MGLVEIVDRYYTPPLCLFGGIGNCLSVYVFCMTSGHRNLSASYYLSALAISDIGFLINLFAVWLTSEGFEVITSKFSCPFVMYLGQVTCFLSVWFIVAFTCERFCAVCYPLTRALVCTVSRAKKVISSITCIALLIFSYVLVIATVIPVPIQIQQYSGNWNQTNSVEEGTSSIYNEYQKHHFYNFTEIEENIYMKKSNETPTVSTEIILVCSVPEEYIEFSMLANHLDSIFTLILPFCIITFLNLKITICVWKLKGQREEIVASRNLNSNNSSTNPDGRIQIVFRRSSSNHQNESLSNDKKRRANVRQSKDERHLSNKITTNSRCNSASTSTGLRRMLRSSSNASINIRSRNYVQSSGEFRVTKMLLLVSTVFLVLNLPSHAVRAFGFIQTRLLGGDPQNSIYLNVFQQWANILFNTNFSVNFLLYCMSGKNFRNSLRNLCWRKGGDVINDRNRNSLRMTKKGTIITKPGNRIVNPPSSNVPEESGIQRENTPSASLTGKGSHRTTTESNPNTKTKKNVFGSSKNEKKSVSMEGSHQLKNPPYSTTYLLGNQNSIKRKDPVNSTLNSWETSICTTSITEIETYA